MLSQVTNRILLGAVVLLLAGAGPSYAQAPKGGSLLVRTNDARKQFTLRADAHWLINVKERFDASALHFYEGKLLTINDRDGVVYEIQTAPGGTAELKRTELFKKQALIDATGKRTTRFDCEGLAVDAEGNLYLSEESRRRVFRSEHKTGKVDVLEIDWKPVQHFFSGGANASFEGIAIGGDLLYVANERSSPRIIEVDPSEGKVRDSYFVDSNQFAFGGPHYSDLAFAEGKLFILNRNHRCILEIEPDSKRVLGEYSFGQMELAEEVAYFSDYPTGAMEGLAIDEQYFWMITDNNGKGRIKDSKDIRPTLFRCKRPKGN